MTVLVSENYDLVSEKSWNFIFPSGGNPVSETSSLKMDSHLALIIHMGVFLTFQESEEVLRTRDACFSLTSQLPPQLIAQKVLVPVGLRDLEQHR